MLGWDKTWNTKRFVTQTMMRRNRLIGYRVLDQGNSDKCIRCFRIAEHGSGKVTLYLARTLADDMNKGIV